ncbi:ARHGAP42 family protein [Megaselia abdita]
MNSLEPLEFDECIVDSPSFRSNLHIHEKTLQNTSENIKKIIKEVKELTSAAKVVSQRQRTLAKCLKEFTFECIGTETDEEVIIRHSLGNLGKLLEAIEDERDKMLNHTNNHIIESLEEFRKKHIGGVRENKKKFDKKTEKFIQSQERFLNMSTKKTENSIQEADASLGMHEREYIQESLNYVLKIQEVQQRIKFEFVEIILAFISGWLVFYHTAHDQGEDNRSYLNELKRNVQKARQNFDDAREKVSELQSKYMEKKVDCEEKQTKRGYLFLMEKKPLRATWTKYYCTYKKFSKEFTMVQYSQGSDRLENHTEILTLSTCQRRNSEFEKRFCFDLTFKEKVGIIFTFQALSEDDRQTWLNIMGAIELNSHSNQNRSTNTEFILNDQGFEFIRNCICLLESKGLQDEGLYRKSGVSTKITKLIQLELDKNTTDSPFRNEETYKDLLDSNTVANALKTYLRHLREPLMTFQLYEKFINAAKNESVPIRVFEVHKLVHSLPKKNLAMLELIIRHLAKVAANFERNKMSNFNLAVVFGPTLLRTKEESIATILDIKFNNIVIYLLIENYDKIFNTPPRYQPLKVNSHNVPPVPINYKAPSSAHDEYSTTSLTNIPPKNIKFDNKPNDENLDHQQLYNLTLSDSNIYKPLEVNLLSANATSKFPVSSEPNVHKKSILSNSTSNSSMNVCSSASSVYSSNTPDCHTFHQNNSSALKPTKSGIKVNNIPADLTHIRHPIAKKVERKKHFRHGDVVGFENEEPPLRVRTLYACLGENEGELSFEPNQIITNGKYNSLILNNVKRTVSSTAIS